MVDEKSIFVFRKRGKKGKILDIVIKMWKKGTGKKETPISMARGQKEPFWGRALKRLLP